MMSWWHWFRLFKQNTLQIFVLFFFFLIKMCFLISTTFFFPLCWVNIHLLTGHLLQRPHIPDPSVQTPWGEITALTPQFWGPCAEMLLPGLWFKMTARGPWEEMMHLVLWSRYTATQLSLAISAHMNHKQQPCKGLLGKSMWSRASSIGTSHTWQRMLVLSEVAGA